MIRLVDIRDHGTLSRFAWFTTSTDEFLSFNGNNAWDVWSDFETDHKADPRGFDIERFRGLAPEWTRTEATEAEQEMDMSGDVYGVMQLLRPYIRLDDACRLVTAQEVAELMLQRCAQEKT